MTAEERPDDATTLPAGGLEDASDPELIALVRAGDAAAYEQLFLRHRHVAIRYARRFADAQRAEDLCSEAFAKILDLLQRGKGPDVAFRAYLLTTVRTGHLNNLRKTKREELVSDHEPLSRMTPVTEDPEARFDRTAIIGAFSHLPERWQAVLWLTTVEGMSNEEVGEQLGIKPNAVASLAFRARAGLRQAYLAEHLLGADDPECRRVIDLLPSYLRDTLTPRRRAYVEEHLRTCATCTRAALELTEVETHLGAVLAPLALTAIGAVPLSSAGALSLVRSWFTGTSINGAKIAVAASVAALGLAASAQSFSAHLSGSPTGAPEVTISPTGLDTSRPTTRSTGPRFRRTPRASPTPTRRPPATTVAAPLSPPRSQRPSRPDHVPGSGPVHGPSAAASPTGTPTGSPTGTPTGTPTTPVARAMAVGPMSAATSGQNGTGWEQVTVPVSGAVDGTVLVVTFLRSIRAAAATTDASGWVCDAPVTQHVDAFAGATTQYTCRFAGTTASTLAPFPPTPIVFDVKVAPRARATAVLLPPAGFLDTSLEDNLTSLTLRP